MDTREQEFRQAITGMIDREGVSMSFCNQILNALKLKRNETDWEWLRSQVETETSRMQRAWWEKYPKKYASQLEQIHGRKF